MFVRGGSSSAAGAQKARREAMMLRREILYGRSERLRELLAAEGTAAFAGKAGAGSVPARSAAKPARGKRRGGNAALAPLTARLGLR